MATCTEVGSIEYYFGGVCGKLFSNSAGTKEITQAQTAVTAKRHSAVIDPAVPSTCTTEGKTGVSHCSVCGTIIEIQEAVPLKKHTVVTDPAIPATTASTGKTEGSHCNVCGTVLVAQQEVPKQESAVTSANESSSGSSTGTGTSAENGSSIETGTSAQASVETELTTRFEGDASSVKISMEH